MTMLHDGKKYITLNGVLYVAVACRFCGKEIAVRPEQAGDIHYCSRRCFYEIAE